MDRDHDATDIGDINASSDPPPEISVPHNFFITFPPKFQTWLAQVLDGDDNDNFHKILNFFDFIDEFCKKEPCSLNQFLPVRICDDQSWLRIEIILENPQAESLDNNNMITQSNILPRQASLKKLVTSVAKSSRMESLGMPWRILTNIAGSVHKTPAINALEDGDPRGMCMLSEGSKKDLQKTCKATVKLPVIPLPESWSKDSLICRGSTGVVRKVTINQGVFAMKTFKVREFWRAEADIVEVLSHPHIVHTFGSTEPKDPNAGSDEFSLLMELMKDDLSGWITSKGLFQPLDSLDVLLQVAQAMEYLHGERVIHGDLKCGNILISQFDISRDAEQFIVVKVADFGNAQKANSNPFIPTKGTTRWSPPEVLLFHNSLDKKLEDPFKADVYSFGLIAYEVLTGEVIFDGLASTLKEKIMGSDLSLSHYFTKFDDMKTIYSESFISFMKRCWACEPTERPSFHEIIEKIKETKTSMITRSQESPVKSFYRMKRLIKKVTKWKRTTTKLLTTCGQLHPTTQPTSSLVESRISEDKIEIMKKNEEAKKDLVIIKSPEPSICCAPAIEKPSLGPKTKRSKSKLGIHLSSVKTITKRTLKMLGKKGKNVLELNKPKSTAIQDPPLPTQPISSLGAPIESLAQEGKATKREFEDDACNDGSEQVIKSHKKRRMYW